MSKALRAARHRLIASVVIAPMLACGTASAQVSVTAEADGTQLVEYDNLWLVTVHYNDGRIDERGLSSDHVRFREIEGKRYLTRIEGTTSIVGKPGQMPAGNFSTTFNIFDPRSMTPIRNEAYSSDGDAMIRQFAGSHVVTRTRSAPGAPDRVSEADVTGRYYDMHGGMTGLLLASLPLRLGYAAIVPGYGDGAIDGTLIRVTGHETIVAAHLGRVETWVVEVGAAPARSTYWISKRAPYVIRAVVRAPNATASWDMIDSGMRLAEGQHHQRFRGQRDEQLAVLPFRAAERHRVHR